MDSETVHVSYQDSANVAHEVDLTKDMFTFKQADKKIHDVSFQGKPTTFARDAWIRFCKNHSSIVAFIILGVMIAAAFLLPLAIPYNVSTAHADETFLAPKLLPSGTGFWDGTSYFTDKIYDESTGLPVGTSFVASAIEKKTLKTYQGTINAASTYAKGGYLRIPSVSNEDTAYAQTPSFALSASDNPTLTYDAEAGLEATTYENASYSLDLLYTDTASTQQSLSLVKESSDYGEKTIALEPILTASGLTSLDSCYLRFSVPPMTTSQTAFYLKSMSLSKADGTAIPEATFTDANALVLGNTWTVKGSAIGVCQALITYCSFRYDTYEATYGERTMKIGETDIKAYIAKGYMTYDFTVGISSFKRLMDICPIMSVSAQEVITGIKNVKQVTAVVSYYRYIGYASMPVHLLGTDNTGRDLLKYVAEGTRNSLLLGIAISLITFVFGLIYGSIEGYFGGTADLLMERFVDILGNIPWIIIVTLCVLHLGQNFGVFILAMCLTDWIGTSSLTRTQFYRFKRREYVLASRSLGASDTRLIFKHILPNSIGTITTASVLMVPSVIFSEAAISYLGIGLKGLASLGVILSANQAYISNYTYLLIFPSIVLSLLMICFNLLGNGLRDAFNPSLKGAD
ncbi:MAG: ABC transporter permease [Bacilli bacterium]|jgi:oligopeptide transport system permease protein|nr:ABC transporter permease [Bacilli bacterium]